MKIEKHATAAVTAGGDTVKDFTGRIMYAPDDSGGAGDSGVNDATPAGGQSTDGSGRTFSQEDVDRIVAERARHAKSSALSDLLKDLGFEKPDDLKAAVAKQRELEAASKTELERAREQLQTLEKEREQWAQEKRAQGLALAVHQAATKLGIVDPEVALALIQGKVEYDDKGSPQGVEEALAQLLESKPYLKASAQAPTPGATNPGRKPQLTREAIQRMSREEINARWDEVSAVLAQST